MREILKQEKQGNFYRLSLLKTAGTVISVPFVTTTPTLCLYIRDSRTVPLSPFGQKKTAAVKRQSY